MTAVAGAPTRTGFTGSLLRTLVFVQEQQDEVRVCARKADLLAITVLCNHRAMPGARMAITQFGLVRNRARTRCAAHCHSHHQ